METGQLAQTAIAILDGSGNLTDIIGNPFSSSEGFLSTIIQNDVRFRSAIIIFLLRLSALIWVIKDSNARSSSFWFQLLAILLVVAFTPVFGLLLYIAIRPQGWKRDKTPWRETHFQNVQICQNCGNINNIENGYCTSCGECLQTSCHECQYKYSISYSYCPNCGAPSLEE